MEKNPEIRRDSTTVDSPPRATPNRAKVAEVAGRVSVASQVRVSDSTAAWVGPASPQPVRSRDSDRTLGRLAVRHRDRTR